MLIIKKSLLEIEKEAAAESATHTKIKSPTRSELHKKCACLHLTIGSCRNLALDATSQECFGSAAQWSHSAGSLQQGARKILVVERCRDQGEAWGNEPLWAVQKPHRSRLELEQEAWRRAVRAHLRARPREQSTGLTGCFGRAGMRTSGGGSVKQPRRSTCAAALMPDPT